MLSAQRNARHMQFSPDSRYILYEDQGAVYVQLVEDLTMAPEMIWPNSVNRAVWNRSGTQIMALRTDGGFLSVTVELDPAFSVIARYEDSANALSAAGNVIAFIDDALILTGRPDNSAASGTNADSSSAGLKLRVITNVDRLID